MAVVSTRRVPNCDEPVRKIKSEFNRYVNPLVVIRQGHEWIVLAPVPALDSRST